MSALPSGILTLSALCLWLYMTVLYVIALYRRDNSIADIGYGIGFIVALVPAYFYRIEAEIVTSGRVSLLSMLPLVMVCMWGARLAMRIYLKNHGKPEDFRYAAWRAEWKWFKLRSYLQIFMLQGAIIFLIALPAIVLSGESVYWPPLLILGLLVWLKGFGYEAIGDWQLDRFLKEPESKGKLMTRGLWKYTRHPNYFGESLMWWGIWILSLAAHPSAWQCTIVSPILITFLLIKVSGIPLLEARMSKHPDWPEYKRKTSAFLPWFPRK